MWTALLADSAEVLARGCLPDSIVGGGQEPTNFSVQFLELARIASARARLADRFYAARDAAERESLRALLSPRPPSLLGEDLRSSLRADDQMRSGFCYHELIPRLDCRTKVAPTDYNMDFYFYLLRPYASAYHPGAPHLSDLGNSEILSSYCTYLVTHAALRGRKVWAIQSPTGFRLKQLKIALSYLLKHGFKLVVLAGHPNHFVAAYCDLSVEGAYEVLVADSLGRPGPMKHPQGELLELRDLLARETGRRVSVRSVACPRQRYLECAGFAALFTTAWVMEENGLEACMGCFDGPQYLELVCRWFAHIGACVLSLRGSLGSIADYVPLAQVLDPSPNAEHKYNGF